MADFDSKNTGIDATLPADYAEMRNRTINGWTIHDEENVRHVTSEGPNMYVIAEKPDSPFCIERSNYAHILTLVMTQELLTVTLNKVLLPLLPIFSTSAKVQALRQHEALFAIIRLRLIGSGVTP